MSRGPGWLYSFHMAATKSTPARTALYECAKCDGRGNIRAFSHIHGGTCFTCKGTGKVELRRITDAEELEILICNIGRAASIALEALSDGDTERAHHSLAWTIKQLFTIGTSNAREILDYISEGEWFNGATMTEGKVPAAEAASLRQWVIAQGRQMKAA